MKDPKTLHTIHTLATGGLTHEAISAKTGTPLRTIHRILSKPAPTITDLAAGRLADMQVGQTVGGHRLPAGRRRSFDVTKQVMRHFSMRHRASCYLARRKQR
jgi:hypothetical protein